MGASSVEREQAIWDSVRAKRWTDFQEFLHPQYVGVYAEGTRTAEQELAAIRKLDLDSALLNQFRVVDEGETTEIVSYRVAVKGRHVGRDIAVDYNAVSVWVRAGPDWRLISHAEVPIS